MAVKKSELYCSLWKSCDELRGNLTPTQYKDYGHAFHFIKSVTDRFVGPFSLIEVPKGGTMKDLVTLKGAPFTTAENFVRKWERVDA